MAGRPRKAVGVSKGKIGKEKRLNRKIQESKIKVDRLQLEEGAPDWLSPDAAEEYMRIVHEAGKVDLLDNIDRAFLAIYADNYDRHKGDRRAARRRADCCDGVRRNSFALSQDCKRRGDADSPLLDEAGACGDRPAQAHRSDGDG